MTLLLLTLLAQAPVARGTTLEPAPPQTHEAARTLDAPPAHDAWSEHATRRFLGALAGGVVGVALPASLALVGGTCDPLTMACTNTVGLIAALAAPVTAVVGGAIGHALVGGEAGAGVGLAALLSGVALGGALAVLHLFSVPSASPQAVALVIATAALSIGFQAFALEARHEAVTAHPDLAVPAGRLVLEAVGTLGALIAGGLLSALIGGLIQSPTLAVISATVLGTVTPLIPYAIHRSKGGRGSLGAAYLGLLGSAAFTLLTLATAAGVTSSLVFDARGVTLFGTFVTAGVLAATLGMPLMLEWSHGQAVLEGEERKRPSEDERRLSAGLAPVLGPTGLTGGALSLSGSF